LPSGRREISTRLSRSINAAAATSMMGRGIAGASSLAGRTVQWARASVLKGAVAESRRGWRRIARSLFVHGGYAIRLWQRF
jgi:hypothetical protein